VLSSTSGLRWRCITGFRVLLTYQLLYHLLDLIIFVVTLVLHWGGRSVSTSGLQLISGVFLACIIPKNQMVSPCHLFVLPYPTACECSMLQCVLNWQNHPWSGLFLHESEYGGGERKVVRCLAAGWLLLIARIMTDTNYQFIQLCILYMKWLVHNICLFIPCQKLLFR
jgi:hypothetical protein